MEKVIDRVHLSLGVHDEINGGPSQGGVDKDIAVEDDGLSEIALVVLETVAQSRESGRKPHVCRPDGHNIPFAVGG